MKGRFGKILFLLAVAALTLWGYLRIHTYSTGQDPRTFLVLAKKILGSTSVRVAGDFVVPGWPLVLAGVIRLFGIHAAFWTNIPLFVLLAWVLRRLAGESSGDSRKSTVLAAVSLLLVSGGYPLNAHFLLWAFRQTPMYLTALLALLAMRIAVSRQADGRRKAAAAWLLGSLAWCAAGVAVRETGVLLLPAMGLYLLAVALGWTGPVSPARKPGAGRWFLFVLFAGIGMTAVVAAVAVLRWRGGPAISGQGAYLLQYAPDWLERPFRNWPLQTMLQAIPWEFGPAGMACLAIGLPAAFRRRNRDFLFFFLLPALEYLAFDGIIKFHWRFLLTTVFFLAPIAALGVCETAGWAWRMAWRIAERRGRIPELWHGRASMAAWVAVSVALLAWGVRTVRAFGPWGMAVTRAEVERAVGLLAPWAGEGRPVLVDGRTRYLIEVLEIFTDWPLREVTPGNGAECVAEPPLAYVEAANTEAIYQHRRFDDPPGERVLEGHADLEALPDGEFRLGRSRYRVLLARPWRAHDLATRLPPPPEPGLLPGPRNRLLRVSVPAGATNAPIRVFLQGRLLADGIGPGRRFLSVPEELAGAAPDEDGAGPELRFESDAPLPAAIPARWIHPDEVFAMQFGIPYPPPCNALLAASWPEPEETGEAGTDFGKESVFHNDVWIRIPGGLDGGEGAGGAEYVAEVELGTVRWTDFGDTVATLSLPEFPEVAPPPVRRKSLERAQAFRFVLGRLPRVPAVMRLHVERWVPEDSAVVERSRRWRNRLDSVSLRILRQVDSVSVRVGCPEDALLLEEGFFQRENGRGPDHGRWTGERAELALPLRPGRDCLCELDFSALRPENAPPPEPRLFLNGHPLETETTASGLSARLPAEWLGENNRLRIETTPWSPADHGGGDKRRLGIFVHAFRAMPL